MQQETWGRVRKDLQKSIGQYNFTNWIEPLKLRALNGATAEFAVGSAFNGTWVDRHFGEQIKQMFQRHGSEISRLAFVVDADERPDRVRDALHPAPTAAAAPRHRPDPQLAELCAPLDPRLRFDSFVVGKPNELAHAAARRVAAGGPVTFSPLFIYGGVGLGKTHLMQAMAWDLRERFEGLNVVYMSAEQFMYRFVQALRERSMMEFKSLFRAVDVLMIDDVHFIAGKDSTQEEFFHTFNALVDMRRQIVISADRPPSEIKDLEERISTRLLSGLVVDLHATTYELRLGILQQKVQALAEQYPGLSIAPGVLEFLAHRISTNVRVLEGALLRLFAFASLVERQITLELAQDCLADVLRSSERKITIDEIQRRVAEHFNIRLSDLIGPKRQRPIARPRQIAMFLCKRLTTRSLPEIGRRFGGRDHTTVMHAIRRIEELGQTDSQLADDVEMLRRSLEA